MASAQVLPQSGTSSRKQEHLEAGKRRLEEFRKKKAAERAKKAAPSSKLHPSEAGLHEKQPSETERVRLTDSDGADTSDGVGGAVIEPSSVVINNDIKATEFGHKPDLGSSYETHARPPFSGNNYYVYSADPVPTHAKDEEVRAYDASPGPVNVNYSPQEEGKNDNYGIKFGTPGRLADGIATEQTTAFHSPSFQDIDSSSSQYSYNGLHGALSNNRDDGHSKDFTFVNPGASHDVITDISPERSSSIPLQNKSDSVRRTSNVTDSSSEVRENIDGVFEYNNNPLIPDNGERNFSSFVGHLTSASDSSMWSSESRSTGFGFDTRSSSNHVVGTKTRSRPSFLDSINLSNFSSASLAHTEPEKADSFSSKAHATDVLASSTSLNTMNSVLAAGNGGNLFRHGFNEQNMERDYDFRSPKQDEDFAALEQHIEDLTQEKFSLQRALEASRALAESLATENSALTDSYNQQGSVVQQLKSDMEKLQEEIKAQLQVELESVKIEYANAHLECNAADERAKLLASEVIGLEEKALRLRSSELKLERQLENLQAEMSSLRKKTSSLEKERQDFQLTIDALQEEKKLLQSKLRKASASGKSVDVSKIPNNKKNVSTSTEDLVDKEDADTTPDTSNLDMHTPAPLTGSDVPSYPLQLENSEFSLEGLALNIPPDQMRMIENINTLISELALEKEELMQALSAESSQSHKLKELNKELSRKLEVQTQRLELLTSMANDNITARQPDSRTVQDNTAYADEGDEVVERVLGWIMKLFPGGPTRRRTSKLL